MVVRRPQRKPEEVSNLRNCLFGLTIKPAARFWRRTSEWNQPSLVIVVATCKANCTQNLAQPSFPLPVPPPFLHISLSLHMDKKIVAGEGQWKIRSNHRPILGEEEHDALVSWLGDGDRDEGGLVVTMHIVLSCPLNA